MPPKKKDDKKKDDKKEQPEDDGSERELVEKELVIGYLKSKLGRYQEHGERLQVDNIKLGEELETQKLNLRDINEFLTNELKARSLTTSALEAKVFELNQLLDEVQKNHEEAQVKLRKDKDKEIENLQTVVKEYEKKTKTTQEFLDRKDQLESELASLKDTLNKKIKDYEYKLTDLDRQHIQDREKWKRETAQRIKETKIQMMKLTDNQLEMTTKRTIMENEQMSIELSYQSRQTEKLLGKNAVLMEENGDLRRQLELSKQTEEELAKRNNVYQKTIKSLLTKLKDQGFQQQESGALVTDLDSRIADLESVLHLSELQNEELQQQLGQAQARLAEKTGELNQWSSRHNETAQFLMQCLEDVQDKIVTVVQKENFEAEEPADISVLPGRLDDLSSEQRERILAHLLEKLHIFTRNQHLGTASSGTNNGRSTADTSVLLPPIPAFPRRHTSSSTPISQTVVAATSSGMNGGMQPTDLTTSWPPTAGMGSRGSGRSLSPTLSPVPEQQPLSHLGDTPQQVSMSQSIPAVDDLLAKVMSDVRPWGKRSLELPLSSSKGTGVFLRKKGAAVAANKASNSFVVTTAVR